VSALDLVIASIVIAFGAAVQGGVGFGINVIAAPIFAILDPDLVPGPGLAVGFFLTLLVAVRDRASLDRRGLEFNIAGRVPGTLLGAIFIALLQNFMLLHSFTSGQRTLVVGTLVAVATIGFHLIQRRRA